MSKLKYNLRRYIMFLRLCKCCVNKIFINFTQRLMVAEMRMIKWICDFTRLDRIRNGVIRSLAEVAPIEEKMRETRLKWFGPVKR